MYYYRITKYNPNFRNELGAYQKEEWTSFSEIGKNYNGYCFSANLYLFEENKYIKAIGLFMSFLNIKSMIISNLEKHNHPTKKDHLFSPELLKTYESVKNDTKVENSNLRMVARLCLREYIWCKLITNKIIVHFGYDYYMYIGSEEKMNVTLKNEIECQGLFVENIPFSPHD